MTSLIVKGIVFRNQTLNYMNKKFTAIKSNESGATAVEYALIIGLIAIAIIAAVTLLGTAISTAFEQARCAVVGGAWTTTCSK